MFSSQSKLQLKQSLSESTALCCHVCQLQMLLFYPGPFKINGVPIRRVNQTYVIATSTKVDISKVSVEKFDDKYFAREKKTRAKKTEGELFETEKEVTSMRHHSLEQVLVLSILFQ